MHGTLEVRSRDYTCLRCIEVTNYLVRERALVPSNVHGSKLDVFIALLVLGSGLSQPVDTEVYPWIHRGYLQ